jgi:CrcB protein
MRSKYRVRLASWRRDRGKFWIAVAKRAGLAYGQPMIWYIALGGALGGAARFLVSRAAQEWTALAFPIGTLIVNVLGALVLGFVMRFAMETPAVSPEMRAFLTTGLCGGFTTFSAFSYETVAQIEDGNYRRAALYVTASVIGSLVAVYAGFALGRGWLAFLRSR